MAGELVQRTVELFHGGQWQDITADALGRDDPTMSRGVADEGGSAGAATLDLTLNNGLSHVAPGVSGRYSQRNPLSDLYGLLGPNTPIRLSASLTDATPHKGATGSDLSDTTAQVAPSLDSPTDNAVLMCAWAAPDPAGTYTTPGGMTNSGTTTDTRTSMDSAYQTISASGSTGTRTATFSTSQPYLSASVLLHGTSPAVNTFDGFSVLRTLTGQEAGEWWVVVSYFGWDDHEDITVPGNPQDTDGGGWILLADSGTLNPGDLNADYFRMKVWAKRVRTSGTHQITIDNPGSNLATIQSVMWTVAGAADWSPRAVAEIVTLPPRRDLSDTDRWVPVQAAGILRRLGIPSSPLASSIHRYMTATHVPRNAPAAYWPCTDGTDSVQFSPGVGSRALRLNRAAGMAQGELGTWLPPVVQITAQDLADNGPVNGSARVSIPASGFGGDFSIGFAYKEPVPDNNDIYTGVSVIDEHGQRWDLLVAVDFGLIEVRVFDDDDNVIDSESFALAANLRDGDLHYVLFSVEDTGAGTFDWQVIVFDSAVLGWSSVGSGTGAEVGKPVEVRTRWSQFSTGTDGHLSFGYVSLFPTVAEGFDITDALLGYVGETTGRRAERLCSEEGVPFTASGDLGLAAPMGPQLSGVFLEALDDCAKLESGRSQAPILVEQRTGVGLHFNTLASLYLPRTPDLVLDFADAQLWEPFEPTPDDFALVNDATARRVDGGEARVVVEDGPKGVTRAGRYDAADDFLALSDLHLAGIARWWTLHGTWDEDRYPAIRIDLRALSLRSDGEALVAAVLALREGSYLRIDNPPDDMPPEAIHQIVLSMDETCGEEEWLLDLHVTPARPFQVAEVAHSEVGILQSDAATLAEPLDTTETGVDIDCGAGPDWVHEVDFDIVVGGERMTVTAVGAMAGTFPNRTTTLTVTRSVNGVVKAHNSGASIEFFHKSYIGL